MAENCPKCGGEFEYTAFQYERRCSNGSLFTARQGGGWDLCAQSIGCKQATEVRELKRTLAAVTAERDALREENVALVGRCHHMTINRQEPPDAL
jgi:hypothetical protein